MYQANGTYYTEKYSVSFGQLNASTSRFVVEANTWDTWHLIPSSRPSIVHPAPVTKYIEIPGTDSMLDLSEYLTGGINYGQRQGSLNFYVDNGHAHWETIRQSMITMLHGKKMQMVLEDDPDYYYEGRFTVGNWESGASYSAISIGYQLEPYKIRITPYNTDPMKWDPFNFETDYDYSILADENGNLGPGEYTIYANDLTFTLGATWVQGSIHAQFGSNPRTLINSSNRSVILGTSTRGANILRLGDEQLRPVGNGKIKISWRGGSL